jgi:hypothetical protein
MGEVEKPKRQCPFDTTHRCSTKCEWFDIPNDQCLMWSFHQSVSSFIKTIQDYMSLQMKIQAGRETK